MRFVLEHALCCWPSREAMAWDEEESDTAVPVRMKVGCDCDLGVKPPRL